MLYFSFLGIFADICFLCPTGEDSDEEEGVFEEDSESDDSDTEGEVTDEVPPPPDFDECDCQANFRYKFKRWWLHYRQRLLADYVRAAYMLSPHPIIQQHCKDNMDPEDRLAMERLMIKIHLQGYVEDDDEWELKKATMMDKFWSEYNDFHISHWFFQNKEHLDQCQESKVPCP